MRYKIVLTCDRTMASTYHGNMFFGFSACLPQGVLPDWFYYPVFCPSGPANENGGLIYANYGMRKIEAALLANGFQRDEVIVAHPDYLDKVITAETKILSISANDPLGIGPATSTFVELWGGEGRMAIKLKELLQNKAIKKYKPTIFLG
ncbi:MAG: radical SAM protein, partial [bacterium]